MFRLESSDSCDAEDALNASSDVGHRDCLGVQVGKQADAPNPGYERGRRPDVMMERGFLGRFLVWRR